jgi:MYXO-CTERM domain-containing protein
VSLYLLQEAGELAGWLATIGTTFNPSEMAGASAGKVGGRGRHGGPPYEGEAAGLDSSGAVDPNVAISQEQGLLAGHQAANNWAMAHGQPPPYPELLPHAAPATVQMSATTAPGRNCLPGYMPNPGGEGCVPVTPAATPFATPVPAPPPPRIVTLHAPTQPQPPPVLAAPPPPQTPDTSTGGAPPSSGLPTGALAVGALVLAFLYFGRKRRR